MNLPREEYSGLKELTKAKRISVTEVFRRAIVLFRFLTNAQDKSIILLENRVTGIVSEIKFPW
jgi:hypothetical protein